MKNYEQNRTATPTLGFEIPPYHVESFPTGSDVALDANRYRWLREHPAFETESFLSGLTPEQYDLVVDINIHDT